MTFPLGLRLRGRRAVVVGGGATAERYVDGLLAADADVLVVAPVLSAALAGLADRGAIAARTRRAAASDLDGAWLVLACDDQAAVNAAIARQAQRKRLWCVTADDDGSASLMPAPGTPAAARPGRRVLVLGGARSGKSATAESMLAAASTVEYIATGHRRGSGDPEWDQRVREHQERRPAAWRTIETLDLATALAEPGPPGRPRRP